MHRIDTPTAQQGKFGAGKNGFTSGDPSLGIAATQLDEAFFDSVQEEICSVIEGAGLTLKKSDRSQLASAITAIVQAKHQLALLIEKNLSDVADPVAALANIGGVPATRTVNGHPLNGDVVVTPWDIYGGAVQLGDVENLNDIITPGIYFQPSDQSATNGYNYPEASAGSLEVKKAAGIIQVYTQYRAGRTYTRTFYGDEWSAWARNYDTIAKPTSDDVNAITRDGCTIAGFDSWDIESPYMRFAPTDTVVHLATRNYLDGNFATVAWVNANGFAAADWVNYTFAPKPNGALGGSGWFKDTTTGLIFQWGVANRTSNATFIGFPIAFPSACVSCHLTLTWPGSFHDQNVYAVPNNTGFTYYAGSGEAQSYYFAVGF